MTGTVILHAFSGNAPAVRQRPTWVMLEMIRRHGLHVVVDWPCSNTTDYLAGIKACWRMGSMLCLLEHDVEVSLYDVLGLEDCPHAICVAAYQLHPGSTGLPVDVWAWRNKGQWGKEGDDFAEHFSFGCVCFKKPAIDASDPSLWQSDGWYNIDQGASKAFESRGMRAHIHWPAVAHHHH